MTKKVTVAALGLAAAGLLNAGVAHADDGSVAFLQRLKVRGIDSTDGQLASLVTWGKAVCNTVADGNDPVAVAQQVSLKTGMNGYDSGWFVGAALSTLCPGLDSRASGPSQLHQYPLPHPRTQQGNQIA